MLPNKVNNKYLNIVKLFADDTTLFFLVRDISASALELNEDLNKINNRAFSWEMNFKPDPSKQGQEILFSKEL